MFSDQKSGWNPGGAKVKIKTNLRLVGETSVSEASKAKIRFKGANRIVPIKTTLSYTD